MGAGKREGGGRERERPHGGRPLASGRKGKAEIIVVSSIQRHIHSDPKMWLWRALQNTHTCIPWGEQMFAFLPQNGYYQQGDINQRNNHSQQRVAVELPDKERNICPAFFPSPSAQHWQRQNQKKQGRKNKKNSRHCPFSKFKLLRPKPSWCLAEGNKSFKSHTRARLQTGLEWLEILVMRENRNCGICPRFVIGWQKDI